MHLFTGMPIRSSCGCRESAQIRVYIIQANSSSVVAVTWHIRDALLHLKCRVVLSDSVVTVWPATQEKSQRIRESLDESRFQETQKDVVAREEASQRGTDRAEATRRGSVGEQREDGR